MKNQFIKLTKKVLSGIEKDDIGDIQIETANIDIRNLLNGNDVIRYDRVFYVNDIKDIDIKHLNRDKIIVTDVNGFVTTIFNPKMMYEFSSGRDYGDLNGVKVRYYSKNFESNNIKSNKTDEVTSEEIKEFDDIDIDRKLNDLNREIKSILDKIYLITPKELLESLREQRLKEILK